MRGFRMSVYCSQLSKAARLVHATRPLCTKTCDNKAITVKSVSDDDAYRKLENLDFMTAAKMLFTGPAKKKEFGLDFHLVQFFFCCLPSVAVYMVAQYARHEIRRMEAEAEMTKKKDEGEEKAKGLEANASKEIEEAESGGELLKVKGRLDALEEKLKEIAIETKKLSSHSSDESNKSEKVEAIKSISENKLKDANAEDNSEQQSKTLPFSRESAADSRSKTGGEAAEKSTQPKK
ncbi:hypothetical protein MKW94_011724 [Papaver nudicaule]|uniref:Uncharacterized protein n=1 Tax=Papaver nudicaule TaxID=74823 RepID=A0AA41VSX2_PAPNU|nr:hypothetical protein [Papaver nudicaule]